MWANAQCDGRPTKYRWHPVQRRKVWLTPNPTVPCSNATKTRNPLKFARVPQATGPISAAMPKFATLCRNVEEVVLLNKFLSDCRYMP